MVEIRLYCCHRQNHAGYLGHCVLIGCVANGVEIFHFVQRLSCLKERPVGNDTHTGDCKQLTGLLFSTNTLLRSQKKNAEIENRQDKGELVLGG